MLNCSAACNSPENIARFALGLSGEQPVVLKPVQGHHRNLTYEVSRPRWAFLKLPRSTAGGFDALREAISLQLLDSHIPAPRLIASWPGSNEMPPYVLTEGWEGVVLEELIKSGTARQIEDALGRLMSLFEAFRNVKKLETTIKLHETRLIGPFASDFSPARWIRKNRPRLFSFAQYLRDPPTTLIHGSSSPNNVLVRCNTNGTTVALLDFEAVRRGPLGFDEAMVWYNLLVDGSRSWAGVWLQRVLSRQNEDLVSGFFANAAWLIAFRTSRFHPLQATDIQIASEASEKLQSAILGAHAE
jgi:hypothetical protein